MTGLMPTVLAALCPALRYPALVTGHWVRLDSEANRRKNVNEDDQSG